MYPKKSTKSHTNSDIGSSLHSRAKRQSASVAGSTFGNGFVSDVVMAFTTPSSSKLYWSFSSTYSAKTEMSLQEGQTTVAKSRYPFLPHCVGNRPGQTILVPGELHPIQRLEIIEPHSLIIVLGEEGPSNPPLVTALEEPQDKGLHAHDLLYPCHLDLSGSATHGGSPCRADEPRAVPESVTVDLLSLDEGNVEKGLRARVTGHEHVVGDDSHSHLITPLLGPHLSIVIDPTHNGTLRADGSVGFLLDAFDGRLDLVRG
mmetsp:Transcript_25380/g.74711  ORF Transcript_25380/g.74711 Transcript_25380/m.74711 type:complete len:259 (-) Transcript_25380:1218-1994(-)